MGVISALSLTLLDRMDQPTEPPATVRALSNVRTVTHNRVEEVTLPTGPDFIIQGIMRDCDVNVTDDPVKRQEWEEWNRQLTPEQNAMVSRQLNAACANRSAARQEDGKERIEIAHEITDRLVEEYSGRGYKVEKNPYGLPAFKVVLGVAELYEDQKMRYQDMLLKDPQKAEVFKEMLLSIGGPDSISVYISLPELDEEGYTTGFSVGMLGSDGEKNEFAMDDQAAFEQAVKKAIDEML